jgi:hypothetical protein
MVWSRICFDCSKRTSRISVFASKAINLRLYVSVILEIKRDTNELTQYQPVVLAEMFADIYPTEK